MPGANHVMESAFLDSLSQNDRPASVVLLHNHQLREIIEFRKNGVSQELDKTFSKTKRQWHDLINMVILTKLTYFIPTTALSTKHLNLLANITYFALENGVDNLKQIAALHKDTHMFFADWALRLDLSINAKKRALQKKAKKAKKAKINK